MAVWEGITPASRENPYLSSGQLSGHPDGDKPYGEATARTIDDEVKRIVRGTHEEATRLLDAHRDELEALVHALLERETLDEEDMLEVTGLARPPSAGPSPVAMEERANAPPPAIGPRKNPGSRYNHYRMFQRRDASRSTRDPEVFAWRILRGAGSG